jgi:hypothetical protein
MLLAVTPFPNPLTTPPVTSTYFILWPCFVHCCCFRSELQCRRVYRRTRLAEIILRQSIGPRCWRGAGTSICNMPLHSNLNENSLHGATAAMDACSSSDVLQE